jgi:hypothetical protein
LWKNLDPSRTASLWGEALKKHARIEQGGGYANLVEYYRSMLSMGRSNPVLFQALGSFSTLSPDLRIVWMATSPDARIEDLAKNPDFLENLDAARGGPFAVLGTRVAIRPSWRASW